MNLDNLEKRLMTWGPVIESIPKKYREIPYAPFSKNDKLGRVADWYEPDDLRRRKGEAYSTGVSSAFSYTHAEEDSSFSIVERSAVPAVPIKVQPKKAAWGKLAKTPAKSTVTKPAAKSAKSVKRPSQWNEKIQIIPITPIDGWKLVQTYKLSAFQKLVSEPVEPVDVGEFGIVDLYDRSFDRVSTKNETALKTDTRAYYNVQATKDPVFEEIMKTRKLPNGKPVDGNLVFASSNVISALVTAVRSISAWDLVVVKRTDPNTGKCIIYFDKREGSLLDLCTVSETSTEPVVDVLDDPEHVSSPQSLAMESTLIQRRLLETIAMKVKPHEFENKNPFVKQSEQAGSCGFRYRKFQWQSAEADEGDDEKDITLILRTEVNGALSLGGGKVSLLTINALTEYVPIDPTTGLIQSNYTEWRQKIDQQRGAVIANELKNNAWKLARWTVQSIFAGADQMKLGFVSRNSALQPQRGYSLLGIQFYKPNEFAQQLNVDMSQVWGILKSWVEIMLRVDDGRYVAYKEDQNVNVKFYQVDQDAYIPGFDAVPLQQ